jgi:IS30 family transposase
MKLETEGGNFNGLIRQYFHKGSSLENITDEQIEFVMYRLNHRPRKGLNYLCPMGTKHHMQRLLNKLGATPHDYWNCTYELNPPFC